MQLRRVVERQRVERPVRLLQVEGQDGTGVGVQQRAVRHHRALGQRGGAGGVEQLREIALVRAAGQDRERPRRGLDPLQQGAGGVAQRQCPHAARQPVFEQRVGEHQCGAGLFEEVAQVLAGEVVVDGHVHQPGAGTAQEADQIGVGVVPVGGDAVTGPQAVLQQHPGRAGHRLVELAVRPDALPVPQGGPPRYPPGAASQDAVHRVLAS